MKRMRIPYTSDDFWQAVAVWIARAAFAVFVLIIAFQFLSLLEG